MRDSVPNPRYSPVCNVLRQWKTSLIPTYRVYRLYDTYACKGVFNPNIPIFSPNSAEGLHLVLFINPRRACAARVTVVVLSVCLSVCMSVGTRYSGSTRS